MSFEFRWFFFWVWNLQELSRVTFSISRRFEFFMSHDPCISLDLGKAAFLQKICTQSIFNRDFLDLPTSGAQTRNCLCLRWKSERESGESWGTYLPEPETRSEYLWRSQRISLQSSSRFGIPRWRRNLFREFCFALLRKMSSSASDWHCGIQNCFNILVMEYWS